MLEHIKSLLIITVFSFIAGSVGAQTPEAPKAREIPKAPCASSSTGCPDVVWITVKGGEFMMGSNHGDDNEKPVHQVRVSDFRVAESEVTVSQYQRCVEAGACTEPHWDDGSCYIYNGSSWARGVLPESFRRDDRPAVCVDWSQARTFSRWVGGDLPTEAQWEYAARGGQDFKYSGSDESAGSVGWYNSNARSSTRAVKRKQKNGYGLYDMSGNVWEWTLDEWHPSYSGAPSDGDQVWGDVPACGANCRNGVAWRVLRGGSWGFDEKTLRVADRYHIAPKNRGNYLGFRPVGSARPSGLK